MQAKFRAAAPWRGARSRNTKATAAQEDGRTVTYNFVREMTRDQFGPDAAARVNLSNSL